MSNGIQPSLHKQSRDALSRISSLEEDLGKLKKLAESNFKMYAELFNKLGETLLQTDDKLAASEQLFETLVGKEAVSKIVAERQAARKQQQVEMLQKRVEDEKKFIEIGLQVGYLTKVSVVTPKTIIVGQQLNKEGQVVGLERQQFLLTQMNEQVQGLFVNQTEGSIVSLPQGEVFKVTETYDIDMEQYAEFMKSQQERLNKDLKEVSATNQDVKEVPPTLSSVPAETTQEPTNV